MAKGLLLGAGALLVAGPVLGLSVLVSAGGATAAAAAAAICTTSGPVTGLDTVQARNARTIVSVTQQQILTSGQGGSAAQQRAELIALMTADTESSLHNYSSPLVPGSDLLPNDGTPASGGDHDSVGLFQQRASWGTLAARMDPATSTRLFVARLIALPAWQTMPPGVAAQTVQQSNFPDRYAATQTDAEQWLATIAVPASTAQCGADGLGTANGHPVPAGKLPVGYEIPATATDQERRAVTFALAQLGKPYVFGATGPDTFDCSGLTMAAWAAAGVQLPHYTVAQYQAGSAIAAPATMAPGDLIFIPGSDGSPPNPQHVGMYVGAGYVIEAPQTGDVVKLVPVNQFTPVIGIRHYG